MKGDEWKMSAQQINIHTNISDKFDSIDISINAPNNTSEVIEIVNFINMISNNNIEKIIGRKDNKCFIIQLKEVIYFYSEGKDIFCKTKNGDFKVQERLCELEENLPKDFIRISNAIIANVYHISSFDLGITGNIIINFDNNLQEYVSKRRISKIQKYLKGGK